MYAYSRSCLCAQRICRCVSVLRVLGVLIFFVYGLAFLLATLFFFLLSEVAFRRVPRPPSMPLTHLPRPCTRALPAQRPPPRRLLQCAPTRQGIPRAHGSAPPAPAHAGGAPPRNLTRRSCTGRRRCRPPQPPAQPRRRRRRARHVGNATPTGPPLLLPRGETPPTRHVQSPSPAGWRQQRRPSQAPRRPYRRPPLPYRSVDHRTRRRRIRRGRATPALPTPLLAGVSGGPCRYQPPPAQWTVAAASSAR